MTKQKPIDTVRIGSIKAAIWKNELESGARYNVTFQRLYKEGDDWKSTESFGRDDLLTLAKVADQTHSRIFELAEIRGLDPTEGRESTRGPRRIET